MVDFKYFYFDFIGEPSFVLSIQGIAAGLESMTVNQVRLDGQVNPKVSQMC